MISLIYVSTSRTQMSDDELTKILKASRRNNQILNITGMLLYKGGNFMQVLEGPEENVNAIYEKIRKDQRHKDTTLLSRETISERQFSEWQMAFQNLDDPSVKDVPGFSQFLQSELIADEYRENPKRAYVMMLTFKDSMR